MALRPGRHGSTSSGELETVISRNGNYLTILRSGGGDGTAGIHSAITGDYVYGLGGGQLPEYSRMRFPQQGGCLCTPSGECRSGAHGTWMIRGWRNILYDLVSRGIVRPSKEIRTWLGDTQTQQALAHKEYSKPGSDPGVLSAYRSL